MLVHWSRYNAAYPELEMIMKKKNTAFQSFWVIGTILLMGVFFHEGSMMKVAAQGIKEPNPVRQIIDQDMSQPLITHQEWENWKDLFLLDNGRVIDDQNGSISHSEGQGYGLLLAFYAADKPTFDLIWSFTRTQMLLRNDGLIAWKWDPASTPNIADINNATDGDILVAYALIAAGRVWSRSDFFDAGINLINAVQVYATVSFGGDIFLLPGVDGFQATDRDDGPVINPSYWVFEALDLFSSIQTALNNNAGADFWRQVSHSGIKLMENLKLGQNEVPAEWVSLKAGYGFATGLPETFGYNAIRIPLYMIRAGILNEPVLRRMQVAMESGGQGAVSIQDLRTNRVVERLTDPGYAILPALISCALDGTKIPAKLLIFEPTSYFPSTLHLLSLAHARKNPNQC